MSDPEYGFRDDYTQDSSKTQKEGEIKETEGEEEIPFSDKAISKYGLAKPRRIKIRGKLIHD